MRAQPADQSGRTAALLHVLRTRGPQRRTGLAETTGLTRAAVAQGVADLAQRGMVHAGRVVELLPGAVCGIGLDVHVGHIGATVVDLTGEVLLRRQRPCDVAGVGTERVLDELAELTTGALSDVAGREGWAGGVTVAVPGRVDAPTGVVRLAPRLRWREVAVLDGLAARTGMPLEAFGIDNAATLGALAERQADDVVFLAGDHGVEAGVVAGGAAVRGVRGNAGEIGHVPLDPLGPHCTCGRRGCWDAVVGLGALLHAAAAPEDPVRDPSLGPDERMAIVRSRAERGDRRTLDAVHQIGAALAMGVGTLAKLLDPAVVVLGGYFAALADWLAEPVRREAGVHVAASRFGFAAGATGAALAALQRVLDDPTTVPIKGVPA